MPPPPTRVVRPKNSSGDRRPSHNEIRRRTADSASSGGLSVLSVGVSSASPTRSSVLQSAQGGDSSGFAARNTRPSSGSSAGAPAARRPGNMNTTLASSAAPEQTAAVPCATYSAPVDLMSEFLGAVMSKQFVVAQALCERILTMEPQNETVREFLPVIKEKIAQDSAISDEDDDETNNMEHADGSDTDTDADSQEENGDEDDVDMISDDNSMQQLPRTHGESHPQSTLLRGDSDGDASLSIEQPDRHEGSGVLMRQVNPVDIERLRQSIMNADGTGLSGKRLL
eukprot:m.73458 g.73458  ORF g.73458 m.73458 type:complete len:284 (-) comp16124_c0_seq7:1391-2242(-)